MVSPPAKAPPAAKPTEDTPIYDTDVEKVLYVYNWKGYIDPGVLHRFTRETGIEIRYENLDSNESLESRLRAGNTGYDLVFPSGTFLQRQIQLGLYRELDKSRLTNLGNVDPKFARWLAQFDPGNAHAVNYLWGTSGISTNEEAVATLLPDAPVDSLAMIWDPKVVSKFAGCGVAVLDAPAEVVGSVLIYLGKDANSEKPEDLAAAEKVLMAARPYIRMISSSAYFDGLVSGEICLALGWSGDTLQAWGKAISEGKPHTVAYHLPREGAVMFLDTMAIPADARHVKNAHLFINFLLRADMAARNSSFTGFPNGNAPSWVLIDHDVAIDQNYFPPPQMREKLVPDLPESEEFTRQLLRTWARFRAGEKIKH